MLQNGFGCYGGGGWWWGTYICDESSGSPEAHSNPYSLAWQAGGGLIYELTDQVTFDVSYRWYQVNGLIVQNLLTTNWLFRYGAASDVLLAYV